MSGKDKIGYAVVGAGLFARFCAEQYRRMDQLELVAVSDLNIDAARRFGSDFGMQAVQSINELLAMPQVHLVHIASPPFTHKNLAMAALKAGKHVLCEKPLALSAEDARQMIELAKAQRRLLAVNLIMRYNPLCQAVQELVERELLGLPLHGFFENYAKDEPLPPEHWFWDPAMSGGIFIEHGVHFYDLLEGWLGRGEILAAQQTRRPGSRIVEQVHCTARYGDAMLFNFYHGFTQAERMDRQELRLLFERGSMSLYDWVPTIIKIDCLATEQQVSAMCDLLPNPDVERIEHYQGEHRRVTSRHKPYEADGRYLISSDVNMDKPQLYGHIISALMADQIAWIRDTEHERLVTESNGYDSLLAAERADILAAQ